MVLKLRPGIEKEELEEMNSLKKIPENKESFEWFKKNWEGKNDYTVPVFDINKGKKLTSDKIRAVENDFSFPGEKKLIVKSHTEINNSKLSNLLKVAASIALILGLAFVISWFLKIKNEVQFSEIVTEPGQLSNVLLPDGSTVILNSASLFVRPEKFSNKERAVSLDGEAYFEIASDPKKPFIIQTGDILTEVIGTKFNINAYNDDNNIVVSLIEGSVRVKRKSIDGKNEFYDLEPYEELIFNRQTKEMNIRSFSADMVLGWKDSRFIFDSSPLQIVLPVLSRKYNVEFVLENEELYNCRIKAEFNNEDLETILEVICFANDIKYEMHGRKVIFKGNSCK